MKRLLIGVLALVCAASGVQAQEKETGEVGSTVSGKRGGIFSNTPGWRQEMLNRQLSIGGGVWRAYWSHVTFEGGMSQAYLFDPDYLFSIGLRYFLRGSYFGIGIDGVMMDSYKQPFDATTVTKPGKPPQYVAAGEATVTQWLLDINLYFRYPIINSLNLVAGAGLSFNYVDFGEMPNVEPEFSASGWNAKAGAEFFFTDFLSTSFFATYHGFKQGAVVAGNVNKNASVKLTSFMLMLNFYI